MKKEDLVIGKEYWLDDRKNEKAIYIGYREKSNGIYFKPVGETTYLLSSVEEPEFKGMIGFMNGFNGIIPV